MAYRHGRPLLEVVRQPWPLTLVTYAMIVDAERIEGVKEELAAHHVAQKVAIAFHDPKRLWSDARTLHAQLRVGPQRTPVDVTRVAADALIARVARKVADQQEASDGN